MPHDIHITEDHSSCVLNKSGEDNMNTMTVVIIIYEGLQKRLAECLMCIPLSKMGFKVVYWNKIRQIINIHISLEFKLSGY